MSNVIDFSKLKNESEENELKKDWNKTPFIPEELKTPLYKSIEWINDLDIELKLLDLVEYYHTLDLYIDANINSILKKAYDNPLSLYRKKFTNSLAEDSHTIYQYLIDDQTTSKIIKNIESLIITSANFIDDTEFDIYIILDSIVSYYNNTKSKEYKDKIKKRLFDNIRNGLCTIKRLIDNVTANIILDYFGINIPVNRISRSIDRFLILCNSPLRNIITNLQRKIIEIEPIDIFDNPIDVSIMKNDAEQFQYDDAEQLIRNCISNVIHYNNRFLKLNHIDTECNPELFNIAQCPTLIENMNRFLLMQPTIEFTDQLTVDPVLKEIQVQIKLPLME